MHSIEQGDQEVCDCSDCLSEIIRLKAGFRFAGKELTSVLVTHQCSIRVRKI
jgi:hypothetical protein